VLSVEQAARYDVLVNVHANGAPLAQTACNLLLNDQFVATIQTNGTLGRESVQKLCRIELQRGNIGWALILSNRVWWWTGWS
jgi:beta-glucosidase